MKANPFSRRIMIVLRRITGILSASICPSFTFVFVYLELSSWKQVGKSFLLGISNRSPNTSELVAHYERQNQRASWPLENPSCASQQNPSSIPCVKYSEAMYILNSCELSFVALNLSCLQKCSPILTNRRLIFYLFFFSHKIVVGKCLEK